MKWSKVSLCYYPTITILIDDKKNFLKELDLKLSHQFFYRFYTQPEEFIEYINHQYSFDPFTNRCVFLDNDELDRGSQNINIRMIRNEATNENRFYQISTLISDYAMPTKNGLECCQSIPDKYAITKILLTGQADNSLAVEAFNKGIINKFIHKSPNVAQLVNSAIYEAQVKYFINLSEKLYDMLPESTTQCLTDPAFADFFYKLCEEKNIVEYYLTDERGSFLMLDMQGKPSWLAIANDEQMESYYEIAHGHKNVSPSIMDGLKTKKMITYFYTDDDLDTSAAEWESYMYPAKQLTGKETYYYAYIDNPDAYELDRNNIVSYQQFLQTEK
ncbi:MAG: Response regulator containing a CheY-like receiver domain and an domain [Gammaproteobacteria bacterium]|jgi:CheY-like chemotaxis protein|nr:Response regulator containing a CheY-like receiver domain and an domain [Gammaproteobacteria bacterium]